MAFSAHKDVDALKEHFEDAATLDHKTDVLVKMIKDSKHFVVFTGAGVSTSAGIPDFRGPEGVWTLEAQGRVRKAPTTSTLKAMPTATHMALVALQNANIMKYLISQNVDGLHRRSGILPEKLSELHGNSNLESCHHCKKEYLRDYDACAPYTHSVHDHRTGRKCDVCGHNLHDTIINFGENLPEVPLARGWDHSGRADLHLVLGSSLTVRPACKMPKHTANNGGKLVIVNLQNTPLDDKAALRIYAKTDDVMRIVMQKLKLDIPPFILQRQLRIREVQKDGFFTSKRGVTVDGVEIDGIPASFVRRIVVDGSTKLDQEPFAFDTDKKEAKLRLGFRGHYNEPVLDLAHKLTASGATTTIYRLAYNPLTGVWVTGPPQTSATPAAAAAPEVAKKAEFKPALPPLPTTAVAP